MNLFKPEKFPDYYGSEIRKEKLNLIIKSGDYIYPLQQDGEYCTVIFNNGNVTVKGSRKTKFLDKIKFNFESKTVFNCFLYKEVMYVNDVLFLNGKDLTQSKLIDRIRYIKRVVDCISQNAIASSFFNVKEASLKTIGSFFAKGSKEFIVFDKNTWYTKDDEVGFIIDRGFLSTHQGFVKKKIGAVRNYGLPKTLNEWLYWEDLRSGKLLYGYYCKDSIDPGSMIEPVSEDYYKRKNNGVIIKLSNDKEVLMNADIEKNKEVTIGCIEFNNNIYSPFIMEEL